MTMRDKNGVIYTYKGDSGHITVRGFNPEINYNVYLQISDEDGNFYGDQLSKATGNSDSVRFYIPASVTDSLVVPLGEDFATFYIGVKCSEIGVGNEDTLIPDFGQRKTMIVYKKYAEGPDNG